MSQAPVPDDQQRFTPRADLVVEQLDDEVLILDLERDVYFGLNPVGLAIWRQLERGAPFSQVIDHLESSFDAPRQTLTRDAASFLAALEARALISRERDGV